MKIAITLDEMAEVERARKAARAQARRQGVEFERFQDEGAAPYFVAWYADLPRSVCSATGDTEDEAIDSLAMVCRNVLAHCLSRAAERDAEIERLTKAARLVPDADGMTPVQRARWIEERLEELRTEACAEVITEIVEHLKGDGADEKRGRIAEEIEAYFRPVADGGAS